MNQTLAQSLQKGDLIAVAYSNYLYPAIFMEFKNRSTHFHLLRQLKYKKERIDNGKKPYINYINKQGTNIIAKIHPSELMPIQQQEYIEMYDLLKSNGYI